MLSLHEILSVNEYRIRFHQNVSTKNLFQNGNQTLSIQLGDKKFLLACPEYTPEEPRLPPEVVDSGPHLPSDTAEHSSESLKHFVWSPPFYLAPPLYPHPTYPKYSHPDSRDPSTSSSTPAPTFGSRSVPPVGSLSEYQDYFLYPDSLNEHVTHDSTGDMVSSGRFSDGHQAPLLGVFEQHRVTPAPSVRFQTRVGSPSFAPPIHTLNQYQHPNVPLPALQYAASAPEAESPLLASLLHHPDAAGQFNMDEFPHSLPAHNTQAHTAAPNALYPAQPHSDQWYHFPHGGPKLPPFSPELLNRHASSHQSSGSTLDNNPYWRRYELLSDKDFDSHLLNAGEGSPEQTSFPAGIPFPPFYHPPQHPYQMYYGPELSPSGLAQMSNNNPLLRTFRPLSPSPLSEPVYDVQHTRPYRHHQPETAGDGDVPHEGNINPKSDPQLSSDSDHDFTVWLDQLSEAENPSMLQANPSNIYLYDTEVYPDVEAPDELLDNQIEGNFLRKMMH